ncbi:MAG TPA: S8 family serine peptidase [Chthoniobacterales bacterium]|jgi:hypothetical protein
MRLNSISKLGLAVTTTALAFSSLAAQPSKSGSQTQADKASAKLPDNLALGLYEMASDYAAASKGGQTLSHDKFTSLARNYPLAREDSSGRVQVEVAFDGTKSIPSMIKTLQKQGCEITAQVDWYRAGIASMWMPLNKAGEIGREKGVSAVKLSLKPRHYAGIVPGYGGMVLHSNLANASGYLGAGVMVGAQSDSYNKLSTSYPVHATQDVASGDLPGTGNPEGYTTPVIVLVDGPTSGEDEGRAMLQIVHDVAPAATLAFRTADTSEADFANGIGLLQAAGCKVICDDVGYYDEPMFSDGVVAQAVDKATALGSTYFSSAGNDGNSGWTGTFSGVANNATSQALLLSEGGITYSGITSSESAVFNQYNSFGTNSLGQPILVQKVYVPKTNSSSYNGTLVFQWDDPDGVTTGGIKQITTDYDILVFSVATNGTATYQSTKSGKATNFSTNAPVEIPGSTLIAGTQYEFVIVLTNRAANGGGPTRDQATHIRWAVATDASQIIADFVGPNNPETYGHPVAATCAGSAAYLYDDQFSYTYSPYMPIIEEYSSNGPVTIYFDNAGNRLSTPITRKQPSLATVDGVSTTFFPPATGTVPPGPSNPSPYDSDGDGYPDFFGTSAAAPHAAGCAALILSAASANSIILAPADVQTLMENTTQGQSDQDPGICYATAGSTSFSARDRGTYADPQAYTITYNGAGGTTLNTFVFDLSPLPGNFYPATYAVTVGASSSGTGGTAPSIAASTVSGGPSGISILTLTLANFTPGSTLSFGIAQTITVTGGNYYLHGDQLAGATITATDSNGGVTTGPLANTYSRSWNPKSGYGLVDVNAAINRLLGH